MRSDEILKELRLRVPQEYWFRLSSPETALNYCLKQGELADNITLTLYKERYPERWHWIYALYAEILNPITLRDLVGMFNYTDLQERVNNSMKCLPRTVQKYIFLQYRHGKKPKDILKIMGITIPEAKKIKDFTAKYFKRTSTLLEISEGSEIGCKFLKYELQTIKEEVDRLKEQVELSKVEEISLRGLEAQLSRLNKMSSFNELIYKDLLDCYTDYRTIKIRLGSRPQKEITVEEPEQYDEYDDEENIENIENTDKKGKKEKKRKKKDGVAPEDSDEQEEEPEFNYNVYRNY